MLRSRADVELVREFHFDKSNRHYEGIPIIASNMDTVGTFDMAVELAKSQLFTTIHKHYSVDEWLEFAERVRSEPKVLKNLAVSAGTSENDKAKLRAICNCNSALVVNGRNYFLHFPQFSAISEVEYICLDVANGYSEHFVDFIRQVREEFPTHTIMVCI